MSTVPPPQSTTINLVLTSRKSKLNTNSHRNHKPDFDCWAFGYASLKTHASCSTLPEMKTILIAKMEQGSCRCPHVFSSFISNEQRRCHRFQSDQQTSFVNSALDSSLSKQIKHATGRRLHGLLTPDAYIKLHFDPKLREQSKPTRCLFHQHLISLLRPCALLPF